MGKKHTKRRSPSVMPIKTYIHEAGELLAAANYYRESLTLNGFKEETYGQLEKEILTLRTAESELHCKRTTKTDDEKKWAATKPKAFALRDDMMRRLTFVLRKSSPAKK